MYVHFARFITRFWKKLTKLSHFEKQLLIDSLKLTEA